MFFTVESDRFLLAEKRRTNALMNAYYIIQSYPLHASELILDQFIQKQYKATLKNLCIKLILNLTFYEDDSGNLILMFKDPKDEALARLITYGNGAIPGSRILQIALNT